MTIGIQKLFSELDDHYANFIGQKIVWNKDS